MTTYTSLLLISRSVHSPERPHAHPHVSSHSRTTNRECVWYLEWLSDTDAVYATRAAASDTLMAGTRVYVLFSLPLPFLSFCRVLFCCILFCKRECSLFIKIYKEIISSCCFFRFYHNFIDGYRTHLSTYLWHLLKHRTSRTAWP